uniref:Uncharacterized protein n=1 Tax=Terrapene triunguis TaxID=2587831 RepID=A0A674IS87_9SAUR
MGTRAFSHDSIFIPDGQAESEQAVQAMSQDKILGKVKTLQVRRNKAYQCCVTAHSQGLNWRLGGN